MAPSLQAVPTSAASASTPPSVDGSSTLDVVGSKRQKPTIISTPPNRHIQVNPRSLNYIQPPTKIPKIDPEVNIKVSSAESNHANSNLNATISNKPSLNFAHHTTGSSKTITTAGTFKFSSEPSLAIQTSQKAITPALLPTAIRPAGTSSYLSPSEMSSELSEKYHTSYLTNDELKTGLTTAAVALPKQALASSQSRKKGRESRRKQLLPQPAQPARDDVSTDEADENQDEPHHLESRNPEARIKLEQEVYSERLNPQLPSTSMRWRRPRLASTSQSKQSSYRHFLRLSTSEIPSCSSPLSTAPTTPSGIKNLGRSTLKRLHQAEASLGVARKEETEVTKRFDMIIQKERDIHFYCTAKLHQIWKVSIKVAQSVFGLWQKLNVWLFSLRKANCAAASFFFTNISFVRNWISLNSYRILQSMATLVLAWKGAMSPARKVSRTFQLH